MIASMVTKINNRTGVVDAAITKSCFHSSTKRFKKAFLYYLEFNFSPIHLRIVEVNQKRRRNSP